MALQIAILSDVLTPTNEIESGNEIENVSKKMAKVAPSRDRVPIGIRDYFTLAPREAKGIIRLVLVSWKGEKRFWSVCVKYGASRPHPVQLHNLRFRRWDCPVGKTPSVAYLLRAWLMVRNKLGAWATFYLVCHPFPSKGL